MKKYLLLAGITIFIFALASTSAMAQFKTFGHMEVETYWSTNMTSFNDDGTGVGTGTTNNGVTTGPKDNRRAIAERMRLHFTYGDPKTVQAYTMWEFDSFAWGEGAAPSVNGVGASTSGNTFTNPNNSYFLAGRQHMGVYQTDQTSIEVAWAFLDFTLPNTPVSAKIGLQRFIIGGSNGRFWMANDAPGIMATVNFAPHALQAFWWTENKQNLLTDNNNDMYGLRYLLNRKNYNVEVFGAYQMDRRNNIETISSSVSATTGVITLTDSNVTRNYEVQPWWVGANVPIKFGNFTIDPTFIYNGGKATKWTSSVGFTGTGSPTDVKYDGWLADVALTYRLGPGLAFTLEGYYSTGTDTSKSDKQHRYQYPDASEGRNAFGGGKSVFFFQNSDMTYYGYKTIEATGIWYARANVEYSPLSWLNLGLNYFYIGDTSEGPGTGVGQNNSVVPTTGTSAPTTSAPGKNPNEPSPVNGGAFRRFSPNSYGNWLQDKSTIGQEINLIATMKIYQNFRYIVGFGYFIPGDVWENVPGSTSGTQTNTGGAVTNGKSGDNAWNILTNLKYTF